MAYISTQQIQHLQHIYNLLIYRYLYIILFVEYIIKLLFTVESNPYRRLNGVEKC